LKKRCLLWLSCLLLALLLAGCGGSGGGGDEAQIMTVLKRFTLSPNPSRCTELNTQAYVEQTTHRKGGAALKACEENAEALQRSELPDSVRVSNVEVDGGRASADVAFIGGTFDSQVLSTELLKDGGQWKLDELRGFAHLDKDAMAKTLERAFEESPSTPLPASQAGCLGERIRKAPTQPLEELLLGESTALVTQIEQSCGVGQTETRLESQRKGTSSGG
jgi:hypothetical protein